MNVRIRSRLYRMRAMMPGVMTVCVRVMRFVIVMMMMSAPRLMRRIATSMGVGT